MLKKLLTQSFLQRTISGIVLVAVVATMLFLGGNILLGFLCLISLIGLFELYRIWGIHKGSLMGILGYAAAFSYYALMYFGLDEYWLMVVLLLLTLVMALYVLRFPKYHIDTVMVVLFGFFYVAVMLSCIYRIRQLESGIYLVWMVFLCSWISDTCAYLVGVTMGKHKFVPKLSPKKTIEGVIGGIAGTVLCGAIYGLILENNADVVFPVASCMIIGGIGSMFSQIGDLAASAIKRNYNIKDYGKLIPGHGGILDRFDSVIFVSPIILYLCTFIL